MAGVAVVIVSHSKGLAEGVRDLARQMTRTHDLIWAVGGGDDGRLGTSALLTKAALEEALEHADAAVVLMDLGSAYLNTVMAIEMLDESARSKVLFADAPLVEGAVLAAISAASGSSAEEVRIAAEEARDMKKVLKGS
ncbi:MAG: dihydroxyacetone kinase phosphoryl donor subunit DhaM [Vulcanimicrobiaceae bacterium]